MHGGDVAVAQLSLLSMLLLGIIVLLQGAQLRAFH